MKRVYDVLTGDLTLTGAVSDESLKTLMEGIIVAGKFIKDKYCYKTPNRPTMLPPIPNKSKFIDKFPEEGCSVENKEDKRQQEAYAAEVKVYRALESLNEKMVVLHSLKYTNRQYMLFKKGLEFSNHELKNDAGECDFVAIGEDYIVIIEVSDIRMDNDFMKSTKKFLSTFMNKEKQARRTKELIEQIIDQNCEKRPVVKWYCAFPNLTLETEAAARYFGEQASNIIFSDYFDSPESITPLDQKNIFHQWWEDNVLKRTDNEHVLVGMSTIDILIGLWNIDSQNNVNPDGQCSFGSNIMKVDAQLRNANITQGFRNPLKPGFINPNFVQADDVFKAMGINYLSKEQEEVFKSEERFSWINGPAGSGKTLLILGKAIQAAKSGENVVIFTNGSGDRYMETYHKSLTEAKMPFNSMKSSEVTRSRWSLTDVVQKIDLSLKESCHIILLPSVVDFHIFSQFSNYSPVHNLESLEIIKRIISDTIELDGKGRKYNFFVDDEQFLLQDRQYNSRQEKIQEIKELTESNKRCLIWILSDITQSFDHTKRQNFDSLLSSMESLKQTYSRLKLTLNLRNTFEIANLLALLRNLTLISTKQQEGHFIHGPLPVIHYVDYDNRSYHKNYDTYIEIIIEKELQKILDSKYIRTHDMGFICNKTKSEGWLDELVDKRTGGRQCVINLKDIYSAEWPVVVFLMDLEDVDYFDYSIVHQLYLGLSRARVCCITIILSSRHERENSNSLRILNKLKKHAELKYHTRREGKLVQVKHIPTPEQTRESALMYAIRHGNVNNIRDVIESGIDVNSSIQGWKSPLNHATIHGTLDVVQLLVEYGAEVNSNDSSIQYYRDTPLTSAVKHGKLDIVKYLVELGADVNCSSAVFSPLYYAVENGRLDIFQYLVDSGANKNSENSSLLHFAAESGKVETARFLIESGVDVNTCSTFHGMVKPILLAANYGKLDVLRYLLESGADIHSGTSDGSTPLHLAAKNSELEVVRYLIESGADVNYRTTSEKVTPLQVAVYLNSTLDVVNCLVESGADLECSDVNTLFPLHQAVKNGNMAIVQCLVKSGANIHCRTANMSNPIHFAAQYDTIDILRYLVESGADVNSSNSFSLKPLHLAVYHGKLDNVKFLVESGANVNCSASNMLTPLHLAVQGGYLEIVICLQESGANVSSRTLKKLTPLHYAVHHEHLSIVKYLVASGADLNASSSDKCTPLHLAVKSDDKGLTRLSDDHGEDVKCRTSDELIRLDNVEKNGKPEFVQYLVNSGADVNYSDSKKLTPLHHAVETENFKNVQCLVASRANVNSRDSNMMTPLHKAVNRGTLKIVQYLVGHGADIDCKNSDKITPLHLAAMNRKLDIIRFIVQCGAIVNCGDSNKTTPLHFTLKEMFIYGGDKKIDVVRYLVESGADVNSQTSDLLAPLHYAAKSGDFEIAKYLVESGAKINICTSDKLTPLHMAAKDDYRFRVVRYLIESGAEVNCSTSENLSPLHFAANNSKIHANQQYLIESGACLAIPLLMLTAEPQMN